MGRAWRKPKRHRKRKKWRAALQQTRSLQEYFDFKWAWYTPTPQKCRNKRYTLRSFTHHSSQVLPSSLTAPLCTCFIILLSGISSPTSATMGVKVLLSGESTNLLSAQELPTWTIRDSSLPQHSLQLVGHGHGLSLHVYFQVLQRTASEHNLNSPSESSVTNNNSVAGLTVKRLFSRLAKHCTEANTTFLQLHQMRFVLLKMKMWNSCFTNCFGLTLKESMN